MENLILAAYKGSQLGVTTRDLNLNQLSSFNTGVDANGVAVSEAGEIFVVAGNQILRYDRAGILTKSFAWSDKTINYTSITLTNDRIYVGYNGSQLGFSVRDYDLNQISAHNIGIDISGISVGEAGDLFITSGNTINRYDLGGNLLNRFAWSDDTILYTCVSVFNNKVLVGYTGSQHGFSVRDLNFVQERAVPVNAPISGISAGLMNDVYLTSKNNILNYDLNGRLINDMTFPIPSIDYVAVYVHTGIVV